MKIIATSDWHLGNMFHGNDRLPEHRHFLDWLLHQLSEHKPDALLVAGDIFDNGNPSAAAQTEYYRFLADATQTCPGMRIIITAGNHDSASRLEAPRPMLSRHNVEIRGNVCRVWVQEDSGSGSLQIALDDLIIPVGDFLTVLAVPYLRSDVLRNADYSEGVNEFMRRLTDRAAELYPGRRIVMMAHMYASGAEIAGKDASEKIIIGGLEQVNMQGWTSHPDYLTCGHIHKRQHIWNTEWARYTGSILPMSFAEKDYTHGVDLITIHSEGPAEVALLEYRPQHRLRIIPENDDELTPSRLKKLIAKELDDRKDGMLDENFDYVMLKVCMDKVNNDMMKEIEACVNEKNAVLCKIQKIMPGIDMTTLDGGGKMTCIDDIVNRDPLETLTETFRLQADKEMNERQKAMLTQMIEAAASYEN